MFGKLRARQKNSFQPLLAMSVVLMMPVLLSNQVNASALADSILPESIDINLARIQFVFSTLFIIVGIAIWLWGSRKLLLRVILLYTFLATVVLTLGLFSLIINLTSFGSDQAILLMKDAVIIWSMTALTFSLWYWLLDSGWTEKQGVKDTTKQDFLFPQQANEIPEWDNWQPKYLDYLHVAFNTNTAFSPTDVSPLSHRVKVLMIVQSALALVIISTVAAQAINILSG